MIEANGWLGVLVEEDGCTIKCLTPLWHSGATFYMPRQNGTFSEVGKHVKDFACPVPSAVVMSGHEELVRWCKQAYGVELKKPDESSIVTLPPPDYTH